MLAVSERAEPVLEFRVEPALKPVLERTFEPEAGRQDFEISRGVLPDAPLRDTTMIQDSDSGDAVGDARPTTDKPHDARTR
jgi:hypothetical protein